MAPSISLRRESNRPSPGIEGTQEWWREIKTGEYLDYYDRMYGNR